MRAWVGDLTKSATAVTLLFLGQTVPLKGGTPPTPTPTPGGDFTLVALPDTQYYVSSLNGGLPAMFVSQTDWIVANRAVRNIAYVAQLGDCVENGDNGGNNAEWLVATNALYRLENPNTTFLPDGIPYGVAVGNHDQSPNGSATGTTTFYNQYFGETHFQAHNYYGGHPGSNNDNHYDLFSVGGLDFIVIYFEYDATMTASSPVLAWANSLLQANPGRRAIVVSHYIINAGFNATFGGQGQRIYDALKNNPNLFLMLSGHVSPPEGQRTDTFNGHTVWSVLSDYQSRAGGGNGWLRLYEFSPSNNVIHVKTYSPWLNQFETDADSQFDIPYTMTTPATPTPTPSPSPLMISGAVSYCSDPLLPPEASVTLTLTGDAAGTTLSDNSGNYQFSTLPVGASYTVTPAKAPVGSAAPGIDTIDVIAVQRHYLGIVYLAGCRSLAADVNGDSNIDTLDVIAIQRFAVGFAIGTSNVGEYGFSPSARSYFQIGMDQTAQNYEAYVVGDVAAPFLQ